MSSNRIQKLLFSEYSDLEDVVLVEGPFAETDRQGKGIRQVQLGLTPTKLILASYFVEAVAVEELGDQYKPRGGHDPDIESFELVSAYPVESVNLSVYRRRRRQTLKARFCNGKVVYYEIGGWQERKMLWSVWCERIKFLSPYESATSVSETSVGSSSSGSSLYIVRSSLSVTETGKPTLWCHYACTEYPPGSFQGSWMDPHLYLGPTYYEKGVNSSTLPQGEAAKSSVTTNSRRCPSSAKKQTRRPSKESLILSTEHEVLAAEAVKVWEAGRGPRVRRRYAFSPCPYLLGGVGPWRMSKSVAHSVQTKRSVSAVDLREDMEELRPTLPKGRLLRTISLESLAILASPPRRQAIDQPRSDELDFWTRRSEDLLQWGRAQYRTQQRYLRATRRRTGPHIFGIRGKRRGGRKHKNSKTNSIKSKKNSESSVDVHGGGGDSFQTRHIYSSLKDDGEEGWLLPVSRFSASSLAHQLTMIHKQLFLQVSSLDLGRARGDLSSWRSPALRSLVFFSLRISCLVANHILMEHDVQKRARVIGKLMNVACKCHRLQSLISAEAVLRGLHSPPIYRLHRTWAFVRKYHATKYRKFEDLSKRYFDCRKPLYQKTYDDVVKVPPFLPSIALLVAVLLESLPDLPQVQSFRFPSGCSEGCHTKVTLRASSSAETVSMTSSVKRFLSALQLSSTPSSTSTPPPSACQSHSHLHAASRETLLGQLDKFFAPVSEAPSRRVLQDLAYFLESHQAAATRYQIPINPRVRAFLLYSRHPDMNALFRQSLLTEP